MESRLVLREGLQSTPEAVHQSLEALQAANPDSYIDVALAAYERGLVQYDEGEAGLSSLDAMHQAIAFVAIDNRDVQLAHQALAVTQGTGAQWEILAHDFRTGQAPTFGDGVVTLLGERRAQAEMEGDLEQLTRTYIATLDIAISTNVEDSTLRGLSDNIRTLLKNGQDLGVDEGWAMLRVVPAKFKETLEHLCESGRAAVVEDVVQEYIPQYYELHLARLGQLPEASLGKYKNLVKDPRAGITEMHTQLAIWPATVLLVTDEAFSRKHFELFRLDMEPLSYFRRHRPELFMENYANVHRGIELGDRRLPDDIEVFLQAGDMEGAREIYLKIVNGLRQTEPEEIDKRVVGLAGTQRQQVAEFAKMMLSSSYSAGNVLRAALAMATRDTLGAEPAATAIEGSLQLARSALTSAQTSYGSERTRLVAQAQQAIVVSSNLLGSLPLTSIRRVFADRVQNVQEQTGQWNSMVQEDRRQALEVVPKLNAQKPRKVRRAMRVASEAISAATNSQE